MAISLRTTDATIAAAGANRATAEIPESNWLSRMIPKGNINSSPSTNAPAADAHTRLRETMQTAGKRSRALRTSVVHAAPSPSSSFYAGREEAPTSLEPT